MRVSGDDLVSRLCLSERKCLILDRETYTDVSGPDTIFMYYDNTSHIIQSCKYWLTVILDPKIFLCTYTHTLHIICVLCLAPDEEPVYVYDYRGLRVRADSLSKAQDSAKTALTTPQSHTTKPRPKSASAAMSTSTTGESSI